MSEYIICKHCGNVISVRDNLVERHLEILKESGVQVECAWSEIFLSPSVIQQHGVLQTISLLTAALEKIRDTAKSWENRDGETVPYWNLGDIAAAALKKVGK